MRVLLSGGGTAGHINPAIAIADLIKQNAPHAQIAFVGTPSGMENRLVAAAGYPILHVRVEGLSRSLSARNVRALWFAMTSPARARRILADFSPDLVIGTGGYVCWPILRAAAAAGIPCALHESNAVPGLTTRRLAPHMDGIWLNFEETAKQLPQGCVRPICTGNPLRQSFTRLTREVARKRLALSEKEVLLLSFGGSLGAERLNEAMLRFMKEAQPKASSLTVIHACGIKHYDTCRAAFGENTVKSRLFPYIDDMPLYMAAADIVLCRAGAMTISEIALCGKCAILVPSPYVAGDHQRKNAEILVKNHAAFCVEEHDLPDIKLEKTIFSLISDKKRRRACEIAVKKFAKPNSDKIIWEQIQKIRRKSAAEFE
ncbi:MAG: undecaprenyldiphospho-muramoylpentapeptide beta-N-acetylglucosaminyltransferase [Clostridia bacterium]|nr:undecaprenyldiphospho-muramoylpentapeptide beta-N-acetylglucosaminyltransferase [Clostridia bacterium]